MKTINVYGLPELLDPESISGEAAVVIDVLRATTTTITAVANGVRTVVPVLEIEETKKLKSKILAGKDARFSYPVAESDILLGGERRGNKIDGFDLGNSPSEYTTEKIGGKIVLFSTTNGTRAMHRVRFAESIYLASFLNAQAVAEKTASQDKLNIICAGTYGKITEEDMYLAGFLVEKILRITRLSSSDIELNVQAISALNMWSELFTPSIHLGLEQLTPMRLGKALENTSGGKNLRSIGLTDDIYLASQFDSIGIIVRLEPKKMIVEQTNC